MSAIKHIDYQGKAILFIDLEGSASDFEVMDLGEKAKKLVKIGSRNEQYVLYNLAGVVFTRQLMLNLKRLMESAPLVSRRVIFGTDARYLDLVKQIIHSFKLADSTRYSDSYPQALNLITDDSAWGERRRAPDPAWKGPERRFDPAKVPPESELQAKLDRMNGSR